MAWTRHENGAGATPTFGRRRRRRRADQLRSAAQRRRRTALVGGALVVYIVAASAGHMSHLPQRAILYNGVHCTAQV